MGPHQLKGIGTENISRLLHDALVQDGVVIASSDVIGLARDAIDSDRVAESPVRVAP